MTPTTATPIATIHHTPTEVFRRLSSPCCRSPITALDDRLLTCTSCGHAYRIESYGPDLRPAGTDDDGTFAEWRDVQSALAAWRAQTWDGSADARARSDETARLAGEFLARAKPAGELLDIGCGSGWIEPLVAARGASYAGIDPAPCAPRYDFPFVRALSDRLPFEASSFDACLFSSSLDYSVDVERTLGEVTRVLRPAGLLAIATPIHATKETTGARLHNHRFLQGELEPLLTRHVGPHVESWQPRENYQCLWVRKPA